MKGSNPNSHLFPFSLSRVRFLKAVTTPSSSPVMTLASFGYERSGKNTLKKWRTTKHLASYF